MGNLARRTSDDKSANRDAARQKNDQWATLYRRSMILPTSRIIMTAFRRFRIIKRTHNATVHTDESKGSSAGLSLESLQPKASGRTAGVYPPFPSVMHLAEMGGAYSDGSLSNSRCTTSHLQSAEVLAEDLFFSSFFSCRNYTAFKSTRCPNRRSTTGRDE